MSQRTGNTQTMPATSQYRASNVQCRRGIRSGRVITAMMYKKTNSSPAMVAMGALDIPVA